MKNTLIIFFFLLIFNPLNAQNAAPANIKSIELKALGKTTFNHIIPLGNTIELKFDELDGDQKEYYYKIDLMTHDWKEST